MGMYYFKSLTFFTNFFLIITEIERFNYH